MRLCACMGVQLHIIDPAGFRMDEKSLRRAGMDYLELTSLQRHANWPTFQSWCENSSRRVVLLTTKSEKRYTDFQFQKSDILLLGRESSGVPDEVHQALENRLTIPMAGKARSINVAISGAMVLGEALRQTQ